MSDEKAQQLIDAIDRQTEEMKNRNVLLDKYLESFIPAFTEYIKDLMRK